MDPDDESVFPLCVLDPGFEPEGELLPCWLSVLAELADGWVPTDPLLFVSVPVGAVEVEPLVAVDVPGVFWALAVDCVPAVDDVPSMEPDCVAPLAVRVFLLLLLQPNTNAAASARPYAYFMRCLLTGFAATRLLGDAAVRAGKSPAAPER